jgi:tetratricopeptide (TPR) repeat protein
LSESDLPLPQVVGQEQTRAVQEALKPHLRAAGAHRVEERIGKPDRYFENIRQRGNIKVKDYLATCAALGLDPADFLRAALGDEVAPEVRPPRIVETAWKRLGKDGPGLGEERLAELESALQSDPRRTRGVLRREVTRAKRDELPRILGLYGSSLRVESDLDRAQVVLSNARDLARELGLRAAEADVLIRQSYVSLERDRLPQAMRAAEEATVVSARLGDREGEGKGFMAMGVFRYYSNQHSEALEDLAAALSRSTAPHRCIAAYQVSALCRIELNQVVEARQAIEDARTISQGVDPWVLGKLAWTEARLAHGSQRLELLASARNALSKRPADRALAMVELIEEAVRIGRNDIAGQEALKLCSLLDKTGNRRVERAIHLLASPETRLTPQLVSKMRVAVEAAQARRLSRLIRTDP